MVIIIYLIAGLTKNISQKIGFYPEPDSYSRSKIKVELDLFNYTTKSDLKSTAGSDASEFAKTIDLVGLKYKVDKVDAKKNVKRLI